MIDLHIHILPGIDDGAKSLEEGLEMARIAAQSGVRAVAATSHGDFSHLEPGKYLKLYNQKIKEFRQSLAQYQIPLTVYCGMELMVNDSLMEQAKIRPLPGINGSRYLLTEFLFDVSAGLALSSLKELQSAGYKIILAHPERYDFAKTRPQLLEKFLREGIIFQINKGSILGNFGKRASRTADWLLGQGMAGLVASDAHDTVLRTPDLEEVGRVLEVYYGSDASYILLERNPRRILEGKGV